MYNILKLLYMNSDLTYKLLKYLVQGVIIYLLFKYVPKEHMTERDILLITTIVLLVYIVSENIYNLYFSINTNHSSDVQKQCNSYCSNQESKQEHMENMSLGSLTDLQTPIVNMVSSILTPSSTQIDNKETEKNMVKNEDGSYTIKPYKNPQSTAIGSRETDDVLKNEMPYNYTDYNTIPVSDNTGSFEYGYSFLPPTKWYPTPPHPPVCVSEKKCPVCPVYTQGTNVDLKEWDQTRRITPPDEINVRAVEEKLNSGR